MSYYTRYEKYVSRKEYNGKVTIAPGEVSFL